MANLRIGIDGSGAKRGRDDVVRSLDDIKSKARETVGVIDSTGQAVTKVGGAFSSLKSQIAGAVGLTALAMTMKTAVYDSTMLAARVETLGVVMERVGANVGYSAKQLQEYAAGVKSQGITTEVAEQAIIRMVQAHVSLSKAMQLARIAQDAAVIGNTNSSEALDRMMTGLATGQTMILHHLGLMTDFEKAETNAAAALNKKKEALNESELAEARANEIIRSSIAIQGSYAAAMGTTGKLITSMPRFVDALKESFGKLFTPVLSRIVLDLMHALASLSKVFEDWEKSGVLKRVQDGILATFDAMWRLAKIAGAGGTLYLAFMVLPSIAAAAAGAFLTLHTTLGVIYLDLVGGMPLWAALNTSLGGVNASALLAAGGVTALKVALGAVFAAFAGWQIGTWLVDNFTWAKDASLGFAATASDAMVQFEYAFKAAATAIDHAWGAVIQSMKDAFAWFLEKIADGLKLIPAEWAQKAGAEIDTYAESLRKAGDGAESFANALAKLKKERDASLAINASVFAEMVEETYGGAVKVKPTFPKVPPPEPPKPKLKQGELNAAIKEIAMKAADAARKVQEALDQAMTRAGMLSEEAVLAHKFAREREALEQELKAQQDFASKATAGPAKMKADAAVKITKKALAGKTEEQEYERIALENKVAQTTSKIAIEAAKEVNATELKLLQERVSVGKTTELAAMQAKYSFRRGEIDLEIDAAEQAQLRTANTVELMELEARINSLKRERKGLDKLEPYETARVELARAQADAAAKEAPLILALSRVDQAESQRSISQVEAAQQRIKLLEEEKVIKEDLLSVLPKRTPEEVTAWNSQAAAVEEVNKKLLEQQRLLQDRSALGGALAALYEYANAAQNLGAQISGATTNLLKGMEDVMVEFTTKGKADFHTFAESIIADLVRIAYRASITGPLAQGLGIYLSQMFTSTPVTSGTAGSVGSGVQLTAHGAAYDRYSNVIPFRRGGVVSHASMFRFAQGIGMMSESGTPEAIMPLSRLPSGDLGVRAAAPAGPQSMRIEIKNESGQKVEASSANSYMDLDTLVIGIVLRGIDDNKMGLAYALGRG